MANQYDLAGRVAVVTGGAQGIGRAVSSRFIASGARVAIWDRDAALAESTAAELGPKGEATGKTVPGALDLVGGLSRAMRAD